MGCFVCWLCCVCNFVGLIVVFCYRLFIVGDGLWVCLPGSVLSCWLVLVALRLFDVWCAVFAYL